MGAKLAKGDCAGLVVTCIAGGEPIIKNVSTIINLPSSSFQNTCLHPSGWKYCLVSAGPIVVPAETISSGSAFFQLNSPGDG